MKVVIIGLLIPFLGTVLGSSMVFFMKHKIGGKAEKVLLGFASGVMIAASVWSLLIPSMNMSQGEGFIKAMPTVVGFLAGVFFLLLLDKLIPHMHAGKKQQMGIKTDASKTMMLLFAVTLHNIPEGMAAGVVLAGFLTNSYEISVAGALALSIGLALQNFPEGAVIASPLRLGGFSKTKSFVYGSLTGIVEPIAGLITIALTSFVVSILPYFLSFAAGAMIYVVVENLIPSSQDGVHSDYGTIGLAFGFVIMMVLDIVLG